jgi:hypothetical protein
VASQKPTETLQDGGPSELTANGFFLFKILKATATRTTQYLVQECPLDSKLDYPNGFRRTAISGVGAEALAEAPRICMCIHIHVDNDTSYIH